MINLYGIYAWCRKLDHEHRVSKHDKLKQRVDTPGGEPQRAGASTGGGARIVLAFGAGRGELHQRNTDGMPELREVGTVRRGLLATVPGWRGEPLEVLSKASRAASRPALEGLVG